MDDDSGLCNELTRFVPEDAEADGIITGASEPRGPSQQSQIPEELLRSLRATLLGGADDLWEGLEDAAVGTKQLVALLHSTVVNAKDSRRIVAAECYVRIVASPQGSARHAFYPLTFAAAVLAVKRRTVARGAAGNGDGDGDAETDEQSAALGDAMDSSMAADGDDDDGREPKGKGKGKGKGKKPASKRGKGKGDGGAKESADNGGETMASTTDVEHAVEALAEMAERFSFAEHRDSAAHAADALATLLQVPNLSAEKGSRRGRSAAASEWDRVSELAATGLAALLHERHGPQTESAQLVLKALLPSVLMTYAGTTHTPVPPALLATSARASEFLRSTARRSGELSAGVGVALQHVCVGAAAARKAEYRTAPAGVITAVLPDLMPEHRAHFAKFLCRLSRSTEPHNRLFACELTPRVLVDVSPSLTTESIADLVGVSLQRSSDKVVSVRAKAISSLAAMLEEATGDGRQRPLGSAIRGKVVPGIMKQFAMSDEASFLPRSIGGEDDGSGQAVPAVSMVEMLQTRAADPKSAVVRKAAIQALVALLSLARSSLCDPGDGGIDAGSAPESITPTQVRGLSVAVCKLLLEHSADPSLLVRKQCMSSLTGVVQDATEAAGHGDGKLTVEMKMWLQAALPMTADVEQSAQEQSLDAFDSVIMAPIARSGRHDATPASDQAWAALDAIGEGELQRSLQRACAMLASKKRITKDLVCALEAKLTASAPEPPPVNRGAWLILSELAQGFSKHLEPKSCLGVWNSVKDDQPFIKEHEQVYVRILKVVSSVVQRLPKADCSAFLGDVRAKLHSFSYPPSVIQGFVKALTLVSGTTGTDEWRDLLLLCDEGLSEFVRSPPPAIAQDVEEGIAWRLFTLGEIAMIARKAIPDRLVTAVEALCSSELSLSPSAPQSGLAAAATSVGLPPSVRAHAYVALGKLCLETEKLAKRCMASFSKELQRGASPVIRNNVMVVMCDLCIRYTGMVDSHIGNMALCLVDPSKLVRQQSLLLISRLLQESYLKLKGPLFFYILRLIVDSDPILAQQAQQCMGSLVRGKESLIYFSHFVEAVFHLNNFTGHPSYNQLREFHPGVDKSAFGFANSLAGDGDRRQKRMQLYAFMLSGMNAEHKLQITLKLTQEVLEAVAEGTLPIATAGSVLQDTLAILVSKEIKVGSAATSDDEDSPAQDKSAEAASADAGGSSSSAAAAAAAAEAKGALLTKIARKNVVENIVPIAVELKRFFEKEHSPLLRNLMLFFKALLQDYKKEMQDILDANKQLADEIEYDLRQLKNTTVAAASSTATVPVAVALPAKSPRVVTQMFSPSVATPARSDIARFSVPRMRPSVSRPSQLRPMPLEVPNITQESPTKPAPKTPAPKAPISAVDIVLPSPFKPAPPSKKWNVNVPHVTFADEVESSPSPQQQENEEELHPSEAKKPKAKAKKAKPKPKRKPKKADSGDEDNEDEESDAYEEGDDDEDEHKPQKKKKSKK